MIRNLQSLRLTQSAVQRKREEKHSADLFEVFSDAALHRNASSPFLSAHRAGPMPAMYTFGIPNGNTSAGVLHWRRQQGTTEQTLATIKSPDSDKTFHGRTANIAKKAISLPPVKTGFFRVQLPQHAREGDTLQVALPYPGENHVDYTDTRRALRAVRFKVPALTAGPLPSLHPKLNACVVVRTAKEWS